MVTRITRIRIHSFHVMKQLRLVAITCASVHCRSWSSIVCFCLFGADCLLVFCDDFWLLLDEEDPFLDFLPPPIVLYTCLLWFTVNIGLKAQRHQTIIMAARRRIDAQPKKKRGGEKRGNHSPIWIIFQTFNSSPNEKRTSTHFLRGRWSINTRDAKREMSSA